MKHVKLPKIGIRKRPDLSEDWVQKVLEEDPSLLGLGDLDVKEVRRRQPRAGELDMLLTDAESSTRYEVELQLGPTDPSHIIRTLEYWDNERRRFPQYEHVAVIVAEEITSRFFNVISLFNGFIPIVAIQMTALDVKEQGVALVFTKVLDHAALGTDEDDTPVLTDRNYWNKKSTPAVMKRIVDMVHQMIQQQDSGMDLNYTKHYIGLAKDGVANNYVRMRPGKKHVTVLFRIQRSDDMDSKIDETGVDTLPYQRGMYRVNVNADTLKDSDYVDLLQDLIQLSKDGL
nr:hypothetical protein [bacterium]